ncbi:MAG: rhodanese-like domain-containing protein [Bacteroidetes bacterium]|nr:rhodanese-like domain-containing protein [Bacteroidota bacterium]MCL5034383.1 rhodanese-like domain-containing protein [Bacteroidota bacterium]
MSLFGNRSVPEISAVELKERLDNGEEIFILDVRQPDEYRYCNIGGLLMPLGDLPRRMSDLDPEREIVVVCHSGARSARATQYLQRAGFLNVKNLAGGIDRWAEEIDPTLPRY